MLVFNVSIPTKTNSLLALLKTGTLFPTSVATKFQTRTTIHWHLSLLVVPRLFITWHCFFIYWFFSFAPLSVGTIFNHISEQLTSGLESLQSCNFATHICAVFSGSLLQFQLVLYTFTTVRYQLQTRTAFCWHFLTPPHQWWATNFTLGISWNSYFCYSHMCGYFLALHLFELVLCIFTYVR